MLGMKESLEELLSYLGSIQEIHSFAYNLLQIKHTCRYLLFWTTSTSSGYQFPKDSSNHRLKITGKTRRIQTIAVKDVNNFNFHDYIKEIADKYGSEESNRESESASKSQSTDQYFDCSIPSGSIILTHNKWSRKYRRSPSTAPPLPTPILVSIELHQDLLIFCPGDGADWEIFLGFINHLRKE